MNIPSYMSTIGQLDPLQETFRARQEHLAGSDAFRGTELCVRRPKMGILWKWWEKKKYPLVNIQKAIEDGHL